MARTFIWSGCMQAALFLWISLNTANGLMCYICGQHELPAPAECSTQFQYDCSSYARRYPEGTRILCRTTRQKYGNDTFTVQKECVSANDHRFTFPGGDLNGCDHFYDDKGFEISYCLCDEDFCNKKPLHDQEKIQEEKMAADGVPASENGKDARFLDLPAPGQKRNLSVGTNVNIMETKKESAGVMKVPVEIPIEPALEDHPPIIEDPPFDYRPEIPPTTDKPMSLSEMDHSPEPDPVADTVELGPSIVDVAVADAPKPTSETPVNVVAEPPITVTDPPRMREIPTYKMKPLHLNTQPTAGSVLGLVCHVCAETNVEGENPECTQQHAVDCSSQYPKGVQTFCFSRVTFLDNGKSTVEKLCTSDLAVMQEYGDEAIVDGCSSTWEGRVNFCVCSADKCNEMTVAEQFRGENITREDIMKVQTENSTYPETGAETSEKRPVVPVQISHPPPPTADSLVGATKCYVCGETDLKYPSDCMDMYQYDCSLAYAPATPVLCLTRQTKLPTGKFAIEKRCISEEQHKQQYPGTDITLNGCGNAWNGYVEYCVCQSDYCNQQNLTAQQLRAGVIPVNEQTPSPPPGPYEGTTRESRVGDMPKYVMEEPIEKEHMRMETTMRADIETEEQVTRTESISQAQPSQSTQHEAPLNSDPRSAHDFPTEPETHYQPNEITPPHNVVSYPEPPGYHPEEDSGYTEAMTPYIPSSTTKQPQRRPDSSDINRISTRGPMAERPKGEKPGKLPKPSVSPRLGLLGSSLRPPQSPEDENKVGYARSAAKQPDKTALMDENSSSRSISRISLVLASLVVFRVLGPLL